jgi:hypothetical protein
VENVTVLAWLRMIPQKYADLSARALEQRATRVGAQNLGRTSEEDRAFLSLPSRAPYLGRTSEEDRAFLSLPSRAPSRRKGKRKGAG